MCICIRQSAAAVLQDERGHSKGFGFVCFASPDAAAKAPCSIEKNRVGLRRVHSAQAVSEMHLKLVKGKALYAFALELMGWSFVGFSQWYLRLDWPRSARPSGKSMGMWELSRICSCKVDAGFQARAERLRQLFSPAGKSGKGWGKKGLVAPPLALWLCTPAGWRWTRKPADGQERAGTGSDTHGCYWPCVPDGFHDAPRPRKTRGGRTVVPLLRD